jgi:endonuclease III
MTDAKKLVEMVLSESTSDYDTWEVRHAMDQKWTSPGEILEVVYAYLKNRSYKKESKFQQVSEELQALIHKHGETLFSQ